MKKKKTFYKVYSNKLTKLKTLSKKLYYNSKFGECWKDAHKVWNVICSTLPNSKPIKDTPDSLVTDLALRHQTVHQSVKTQSMRSVLTLASLTVS